MNVLHKLRYARFDFFQSALRPISAAARLRRTKLFLQKMQLSPGNRVLDVGGLPATWDNVSIPLQVTILNLPGNFTPRDHTVHKFKFVEGDGCSMPQFVSGEFDVVFSNSVIEHVGPEDRQRAFASEVLRMNAKYWIQTPSKWFPIEPHCGMPLWWFYPEWLRKRFLDGWHRKLPAWTDSIADTRVLDRDMLLRLFPDAKLWTERVLGLPKSYVLYRNSA